MEESEEMIQEALEDIYNAQEEGIEDEGGESNKEMQIPEQIIRKKIRRRNGFNNSKSYYVVRPKWNQSDLKKLMQLYKKYPDQWNAIASHFENRKKSEILAKFKQLKNREDWKILILQKRKKGWTPQQNQNLLLKVKQYNYDWIQIQREFGRSEYICKMHYRDLQRRKSIWKEEQLQKLIAVGPTLEKDWEQSYKYFSNRTSMDCRQKYQKLSKAIQKSKAYYEEEDRTKQGKDRFHLKQPLHDFSKEVQQQLKQKMMISIKKCPSDELQNPRKRKWLQQEDNFLIFLQTKYNQNWILISQLMYNRSSFQCQNRYKKFEQRQLEELDKSYKPIVVQTLTAYLKSLDQNQDVILPSSYFSNWTKEEQLRLARLADQNPGDINYIMKFFPDKTRQQIKKKINNRLSVLKVYCGPRELNQQDQQLLQLLMINHQGNLQIILNSFPDYSHKDIYRNYLRILKTNHNPIIQQIQPPKVRNIDDYLKEKKRQRLLQDISSKEREWFVQEDMNLLMLCEKYKEKWNFISESMFGRTVEQVKRRFQYLKQNKVSILKHSAKYSCIGQITANIIQETHKVQSKIRQLVNVQSFPTETQNENIYYEPPEMIKEAKICQQNDNINKVIPDDDEEPRIKDEQEDHPVESIPELGSEDKFEKHSNLQDKPKAAIQQQNQSEPMTEQFQFDIQQDKVDQQQKLVNNIKIKKVQKPPKFKIKIKPSYEITRSQTNYF